MFLILKLKKYKAISRLEVLNIRVSRKFKFPLDINIVDFLWNELGELVVESSQFLEIKCTNKRVLFAERAVARRGPEEIL